MHLTDKQKMAEALEIRIRELYIVYYEIEKSTNQFRELAFGPEVSNNVRFDTKNIIFSGHSFGGNSAYIAARELGKNKVRAKLLFDPCIYILDEQYQYISDVPMFSIHTETLPI